MREAMNAKVAEAEAARQQVSDTEAQLTLANRRMARLQQVFETVMAAREEERQGEASAAAARERAAVAATGRLEAALKAKEAEVADARNRLASAAALHSRAEGLVGNVAELTRQIEAERRCVRAMSRCSHHDTCLCGTARTWPDAAACRVSLCALRVSSCRSRAAAERQAKELAAQDPGLGDLRLKEGQTIRVKVPRKAKGKHTRGGSGAGTAATGAGSGSGSGSGELNLFLARALPRRIVSRGDALHCRVHRTA